MYFLRILTSYSEDYDSGEIFCQTTISLVHLSVAVFVFCIGCKWETSNLAVLSDIFICLHPTLKNVVIPWTTLLRLIMLHCTDMGTLLSFDYVGSSFSRNLYPIYKYILLQRCTILVSRYKLKILSSYFEFNIDKLY